MCLSYLQCLNDGCPRRVCLPYKTRCLEEESQKYTATKFFWEYQRRGFVCSDCSEDSYSDQLEDIQYADFQHEFERKIHRLSQESRGKGGCDDKDLSSSSSDEDEPLKKKSRRKILANLSGSDDYLSSGEDELMVKKPTTERRRVTYVLSALIYCQLVCLFC